MRTKNRRMVYVDEAGRLVLPPETAARLGLRPGAGVLMEEGDNVLRLFRSVSDLAKVYVEPTNACNLDCITCMRHVWEEPLGQMSAQTFQRVLEGLRLFHQSHRLFWRHRRAAGPPADCRDDPAGQSRRGESRANHERHLAQRGHGARAYPGRSGCAVGFAGWRDARELR